MTDSSIIIQRHCIAIEHESGHGSGVLIQGMTDEYSYVLTARHVLQIDKNKYSAGMRVKEELTLLSGHYKPLEIKDLFYHDDFDIAVICIDFIPELTIFPCKKSLSIGTDTLLYGCPVQDESTVKNYPLKYNSIAALKLELIFIEANVQASEIEGFSVGGVFYIEDTKIYLLGVETSTFKQGEFVSRIKGYSVTKFEKLVKANGLVDFRPVHMSSFTSIAKSVFPECYYRKVHNNPQFYWNKFLPAVDILRQHCKENVCRLNSSPSSIMVDFIDDLKVNSSSIEELEDKNFWIKFLEFLAIYGVVHANNKDDIKFNHDLRNIFNDYKLVYIRSNTSWASHFEDILTIDTGKLNENGKLILFVGDDPNDNVEIPSGIIEDCIDNISSARPKDDISNAERISERKYSLVNWAPLHNECIFKVREQFKITRHIEHNFTQLQTNYSKYLLIARGQDD